MFLIAKLNFLQGLPNVYAEVSSPRLLLTIAQTLIANPPRKYDRAKPTASNILTTRSRNKSRLPGRAVFFSLQRWCSVSFHSRYADSEGCNRG